MYSEFIIKANSKPGSKPEVESTTNDKLYKDILIMSWAKIISVVAPIAIDMMFGDKDGDGAQQQQGLVAPPDPAKVFKKTDVAPFSFDKPTPTTGRARIVGAEPALEAVDPSAMESRYWSAIFSDAKAKSSMSFTGFSKRERD